MKVDISSWVIYWVGEVVNVLSIMMNCSAKTRRKNRNVLLHIVPDCANTRTSYIFKWKFQTDIHFLVILIGTKSSAEHKGASSVVARCQKVWISSII